MELQQITTVLAWFAIEVALGASAIMLHNVNPTNETARFFANLLLVPVYFGILIVGLIIAYKMAFG